MDKTTLVEKTIKNGRQLIEELDKTEFDVCGALWFYLTDGDEWRLIIASAYADINGPKKSYEFIQNKMKKLPKDFDIPLSDITVLSPKDELIRLLRIAIRTKKSISGIRFTRNVINNKLIEDAYIYRLM